MRMVPVNFRLVNLGYVKLDTRCNADWHEDRFGQTHSKDTEEIRSRYRREKVRPK